MKQSEAAEFWPLIKAWSEGKTLQMRVPGCDYWDDVRDGLDFCLAVNCYRIKPEPREVWVFNGKAYITQEGANQAWQHSCGHSGYLMGSLQAPDKPKKFREVLSNE
jgi:hypothetical protein